MTPAAALLQGIARILSGDLDGGDASLEMRSRHGAEAGAHENLALALGERSLVAMARGEWSRAGGPGRPGRQRRCAGPGSRTAMRCPCLRGASPRSPPPGRRPGGAPGTRQRSAAAATADLRHPHLAVQARIELTRVHLALADLAGARTLMREIDELLRRRPDLGTLVGESEALRARLSRQRGAGAPGPSSLTAAELRVLPLLATHLSSRRSPPSCSCPCTPSSRSRPRCTGSSAPPPAARPSPGPVSWDCWKGKAVLSSPRGGCSRALA